MTGDRALEHLNVLIGEGLPFTDALAELVREQVALALARERAAWRRAATLPKGGVTA